jgi:hypothetical protein
VRPVLSGEIVKRKQDLPVFGEALDRLGILGEESNRVTPIAPIGSSANRVPIGRVENRIQCSVGQAYLLPPLSSGGASLTVP